MRHDRPHLRRHGARHRDVELMRRRALLLVAAVVVVGLSACQPIVVGEEGVRSSAASRAVDPVTLTVAGRRVPGVDIRIRDCNEVHLQQDGKDPIVIGLQPRATVRDANGTVVFLSAANLPEVRPAGSYEVGVDDSADGAHHTLVPLAGVAMPITISFRCDAYTPGSHGLYPRWIFPACRTNTRTCNATVPGTGEWHLTAG